VDGGSEDRSREVVRILGAGRDNLFLLENPRRTAPAALNVGLSRARGQVVIRVDGHCAIPPGYVRRCVAHLSDGEADGVGGPIDTVGRTRTARAIALAMRSRFGVGDCAFRTARGDAWVDSVPFPAYPRRAIERAGRFDEELVRNQDDEYNYRLRALGGRIRLAEDLRSVYYSRATLAGLARQYFQYGYWKVRVLQKHPSQMMPRQFAPPLLAAFLGAALLALPFSSLSRVLLAAVLAAYAAAGVLASVRSAKGEDRGLRPLVCAAFATLHLAYGSGFLAGLVRFAGRWRFRTVRA
jgi:glycosyltransferase involved in cell wall biosynthesis